MIKDNPSSKAALSEQEFRAWWKPRTTGDILWKYFSPHLRGEFPREAMKKEAYRFESDVMAAYHASLLSDTIYKIVVRHVDNCEHLWNGDQEDGDCKSCDGKGCKKCDARDVSVTEEGTVEVQNWVWVYKEGLNAFYQEGRFAFSIRCPHGTAQKILNAIIGPMLVMPNVRGETPVEHADETGDVCPTCEGSRSGHLCATDGEFKNNGEGGLACPTCSIQNIYSCPDCKPKAVEDLPVEHYYQRKGFDHVCRDERKGGERRDSVFERRSTYYGRRETDTQDHRITRRRTGDRRD